MNKSISEKGEEIEVQSLLKTLEDMLHNKIKQKKE
jgi:hypothetical protein